MTDLVLEHDGIVDKYIGDAVMAFWGAPLRDPLHAEKAMRCAIAMRDRLDELRPVWAEQYGVTEMILSRAAAQEVVPHVQQLGLTARFDRRATVLAHIR